MDDNVRKPSKSAAAARGGGRSRKSNLSGKTLSKSKTTPEDDVFGSVLPEREGYPQAPLGLTIAIVLCGRRWRSIMDDKLRAIGMSASRMEAMASIAYAPAGATQIQVAKSIGIEGPTLTRTLDMLEADGLVERLPDPSDRRNKHMKLTPAGFTALAEMFAICDRLRSRLVEGLPQSEVVDTTAFLRTLIERLDEGLTVPDND